MHDEGSLQMDLVEKLTRQGRLRTERIIQAFREIERKDFVPEGKKDLAGLNRPLSIGEGQTISQPAVVALMLELLSPEKGDEVLDIGSGSGWTTALLAEITGRKGRVTGLEIVPELVEFGTKNLSRYNFIGEGRAEIIRANGKEGYEKRAPFDRILVSAEADKIYSAWKTQLRVGGRIVTPVGKSIWKLEKEGQNKFNKEEHKGFVFVPLVG